MINGKLGTFHPHTWEMILYFTIQGAGQAQFYEIEATFKDVLGIYQDKTLNMVPPFNDLNPTLENASEYFYSLLHKAALEKEWTPISFEISETPTRTYIISPVEKVLEEDKKSINKYKKNNILDNNSKFEDDFDYHVHEGNMEFDQ